MTVPTIRPDRPSWIDDYTKKGWLTRQQAERLVVWSQDFNLWLQTKETELVYYKAREDECRVAIKNLGYLLHYCTLKAQKVNKTDPAYPYLGWCHCRAVTDASKAMQSRVLTYLPEMLSDPDEIVLLREVVKEHGWTQEVA